MTAEAQARKLRKEAKMQARRAQLALKRQDDGGPLAWRGWFDGSAHPNPGKLGIGALLLGPNGERIEVSAAAGHGSSSDAEYAALTAVLQAALKLRPPPVQLLLHGDSQVVINDVLGTTPVGAKGLEVHRASVVALLQQFNDVSLRWIPRHRNGEADRLSQLAISNLAPEA
ncbi:MAG: ribonuclease HI family protein [Janthinobacterium sp.]